MQSGAGRAFEEAVQQMEMLTALLESGIHAEGVGAERTFRQGLQRIAAYCHDCAEVLDACREARTAAVHAFAPPHDARHVTELRRALGRLAEEVRSARGDDAHPKG